VDILKILRGKASLPDERDSITWGQSAVLKFPIGGAPALQSPQLVRAKRSPPTTWNILTTFQFLTTAADFSAAQNLIFEVVYKLGVGQVQTDFRRQFFFATSNPFGYADANAFSDALTVTLPTTREATAFSRQLDVNSATTLTFLGATYAVVDQVPAEDVQVSAVVRWTPNVGSGGAAQCIVTSFVAPVVY
jgi:hypothetical protein